MRRPFPFVLTLCTLVAMGVLVSLGTWQWQRRAWKEDLLARIEALQGAPARPLREVLAGAARGEDVAFARVFVDCPGLDRAPFVELYALREGRMGWRLVSACPVQAPDAATVLIDRGFVPEEVAERPPVEPQASAPVRVTGVLRAPDPVNAFTPAARGGRWFSRDVQAMAEALGAERPYPLMLVAETSSNPDWAALDATALPGQISNRHLEYALTWWALAATLAAVYAAVVFGRRPTS